MECFYVVEIGERVWLADWSGDPGRTCDRARAARFASYDAAAVAMGRAHKMPSISAGKSRLRAVPNSEAWVVTVDSNVIIPALGQVQARAVVKWHQSSAKKITVQQADTVIAEWVSGNGWTHLPARDVAQ